MNASVEVFTLGEDADSRQQKETATKRTDPFHVEEASSGASATEEPLVEAMKSLRDQLDMLESSYDVKRNSVTSDSRAASCTRGLESSGSRFSSGGDTRTFPVALNGNGNISGSMRPDSAVLGEEVTRSSRQQSMLTPSRRMPSSSTVQNGISSPVRYDPSVLTEDPSLRSEHLSTRTPPRPTTSSGPVQFVVDASKNDHPTECLPSSATKQRSRTTPYRSPFSAQKSVNQSFVSYIEPEPVQTPNPSVFGGGARGLSQPPELRLLDSLVGTVEAFRKRMDEQEVRLEIVERSNAKLQEEVRYWRTEASKWQFESQHVREMREEERRAFRRRQDDVPELHRYDEDRHKWQREESRRSRERTEGFRDSPREESHKDWQREGSRRSADLHGFRETPARRTNATSPGGLFVEELSEKLPLDTDQYEVLVSLMNRYFVEEGTTGRRGP
eukprot:scaffold2767_cov177-Amphora_coffeaeformis.AAC.97